MLQIKKYILLSENLNGLGLRGNIKILNILLYFNLVLLHLTAHYILALSRCTVFIRVSQSTEKRVSSVVGKQKHLPKCKTVWELWVAA